MDHYKFQIGDIVRCIPIYPNDKYYKNKLGKIIEIHPDPKNRYCIEFFEPIKYGHDGKGLGKNGYCRWFNEDEIELYQPILKIFLKEKKDGSL